MYKKSPSLDYSKPPNEGIQNAGKTVYIILKEVCCTFSTECFSYRFRSSSLLFPGISVARTTIRSPSSDELSAVAV